MLTIKVATNALLISKLILGGIMAVAAFVSLLSSTPVKADTVDARCDIYSIGEDRASASVACTFSQKQGFVTIEREDGISYELEPVENQPGTYVDKNGNPAYRQAELGSSGHIYRIANESVYVYWDTSAFDLAPSSSEPKQPKTDITSQNSQAIAIQITDGEFYFSNILKRSSNNQFTGTNGQVRVVFNPFEGHVTIFSETTGEELYNYYIEPIPTLEDPKTMCDPTTEAC